MGCDITEPGEADPPGLLGFFVGICQPVAPGLSRVGAPFVAGRGLRDDAATNKRCLGPAPQQPAHTGPFTGLGRRPPGVPRGARGAGQSWRPGPARLSVR